MCGRVCVRDRVLVCLSMCMCAYICVPVCVCESVCVRVCIYVHLP